ncbi:MAG TPA: 30S ribosomal protein S16, partial [Anaerolineales bacterium]|nr:30S ribosomal protein S16 [Anaerolineales bacterium]
FVCNPIVGAAARSYNVVKYALVISARKASFHAHLSCLSETQNKSRRKSKMVRIRLRRIGLKGQPTYRIVAADKESPRDGRFLEILGFYNPRTDPATIHVDEARAYHWMKNGALPTESAAQVFKSAGILERFERFKKGEPVETLVKEAEEAEAKRGAPGKTSK